MFTCGAAPVRTLRGSFIHRLTCACFMPWGSARTPLTQEFILLQLEGELLLLISGFNQVITHAAAVALRMNFAGVDWNCFGKEISENSIQRF